VERVAEVMAKGTSSAGTPVSPTAQPAVPDRRESISDTSLTKAGLVVGLPTALRGRVAEEISLIQHQVLRTAKAAPATGSRNPRLVLVTSARPGEGKTFMSLNVAASIAASGSRSVVLIDSDGKRGSLSDLLGCADKPGLKTLAGGALLSPVSLLIPTAVERLAALPYGISAPGTDAAPSGAMLLSAVQRLSEAVPDHIIVVDTPPCLSTSDAACFAPAAGQVLMVVAAETTQRNEVEAALDMMDACPALQLVLNQAEVTSNDSFGAYGSDYYDTSGPKRAR
jgi:receptor protein-tyrosine kinase